MNGNKEEGKKNEEKKKIRKKEMKLKRKLIVIYGTHEHEWVCLNPCKYVGH